VAQVTDVLVPDIGDFTDVPVIEILVAVGDTVELETPLVALESDKATMEIPSPIAGVVQEILVALGATVSQGTLLARVASDGDGAAPPVVSTPPAAEPSMPPPAPAPPPQALASEPPPSTTPAELIGTAAAVAAPPPYASPSVRRAAREAGVDLSEVTGTGRKGRIVRRDIDDLGLAAPASRAPAAAAPALGLVPWPQIDFAQFGEIEREPLSRIARIAGPYLQRNWVTIPHVTQFDEADITDLEAFRKQTNEEQKARGTKLTMVALVMKACVASLRAHPHVNSSLDGADLILKRYFHIGFAADTPHGLVVPVIRDVDKKGILDVADELTQLSGKARDGKLTPAEMAGGTFTISSLGGIGGTAFTPIVNAPEVAILGVSRAAMKPVWNGTEFRPRLMLPLSLSYDHRVIDGAAAARFTVHLAGVLADLRKALL
jgi:pyruvate dehydrogenase E2 component (dihydrolipoamide acetyltransferase)